MDPVPHPAPRTCSKHGVVLDPFGHCVICRREDVEVDEDPGGARKAGTALFLLAGAVACVLLYKGMTSRKDPPIVRVTAPTVAPPTQAAPIEELRAAQEDARAAAKSRDVEDRKAAIEKQMLNVPIRIYTTKWCELCKTAMGFMKGKGYAVTEIDVEASPESLAAMGKLNPANTVPTIVVGEEVIVGFGPSAVMAAVYRAADKRVR
ncbi:MAG: glutaredoxin family protein [Minicystis sp.]